VELGALVVAGAGSDSGFDSSVMVGADGKVDCKHGSFSGGFPLFRPVSIFDLATILRGWGIIDGFDRVVSARWGRAVLLLISSQGLLMIVALSEWV